MRPLEPDDPRRVGTRGRRYRVLARIGSGGMGTVYLGRSAGGRTVAIKMVHPEFAADREFRARFEREAAVARAVGGAFTAAVVDADPHAEIPWLVTEFLPSVSVRDAVRSSGPLAADAVWALAAGIAEALVSIHRAGVVHRDLKPANVLLTADGPRVIDFGIARAVDASTVSRPGTRAGSPGFMSPEQVAGAEIGPAGDVFSFGSTLAFACTGEEPFGEGPWHVRMLRVQSEPPRLDGVADGELRAVIESCMERDPERRPTAEQLAGRLAGRGDGGATLPPSVAAEIAGRRAEAENPPAVPPRPPSAGTGPRRTTRRAALRSAAVAAVLLAGAGVPVAVRYGTGDTEAGVGTGPSPGSASAAPASAAPLAPSRAPAGTPTATRGEIRFSLKGNGTLTSLTYMVDAKSTRLENVRLPWRKAVPRPVWPPRISYELAYSAPSGDVSYTIEVDGRTVTQGTGLNGHAEGVY
ncbi:serine/threonine-protein kinase [Actinomadura rubrisoli]|uniref:serine/threonine-protein kinase n=1 Tax=Actinomadura rubrisoli TaxID=2530368 RepID=UPI001A9F4A69|nr:serine/threonine-protein kinase [Actinomadura rubrisoli]